MAESTGSVRWQDRPPAFLATIAAVVLVVALLAGFGGGYLFEHNRTKSDVDKLKKQLQEQTTKKPAAAKPAAAKAGRVVGSVTAVTASSVTVKLKNGTTRKLATRKSTVVGRTASGAVGDIVADARVVVAPDPAAPKGSPRAKAVIVLPKTGHLGATVQTTDATSMTIKAGSKVSKVTTTGATIDKVSTAAYADVKTGTKIMLQSVKTKAGAIVVTEIILLPTDSVWQ